MASMHQIKSGRALLAAEVVGTGDPVIFLHAAICDRRMWWAQMATVGATHQAIAYDRRGFGQTCAETEDHSAVGDLLAVMDAFAHGRPVTLVACSQGGRIALDTTLQHPSRVRRLALIAPTVPGAPEAAYPPGVQAQMAALKQAEVSGDLDGVNAMKAHLFLDGPQQAEGRVGGAARQLFLDMHGTALRSTPAGLSLDTLDTFRRLAEITAPTLVMWGDFDFPHIQERSRRVSTLIRGGVGQEVPGVAHLPSLDQPEAISRLLADFI